ncbi:MAG: VWA domain-containing protein [Thermodesulfovibrionales bacterium]|nr:VWA domain-containing protein [Thermodesulfovibrionales bacterium]
MRKILLAGMILLLSLTACDREKLEKARAIMKQESMEEVQVAVLFDNSLSYKPFIDDTLIQVRDVFRYLAATYPEANTTLIMIDKNAKIIWSGLSRDLQKPYDELKNILKNKTSKYTNLIDAVNKAVYFLNKEKANRQILIIFSDMKHSMPDYHPRDYEVVPPPEDYPWEGLKGIETYAFFVPYKEWHEWVKVMDQKGVKIKGFLPEELKTAKAVQIVFEEE